MSQVTEKMSALRCFVRYAIFHSVEILQFATVHLDEDVPDLYIDLKFNCRQIAWMMSNIYMFSTTK